MRPGLTIDFAPHTDEDGSAVVVPCIQDLDDAGEVVGFEIIGLAREAGTKLLEGVESAMTSSGTSIAELSVISRISRSPTVGDAANPRVSTLRQRG